MILVMMILFSVFDKTPFHYVLSVVIQHVMQSLRVCVF